MTPVLGYWSFRGHAQPIRYLLEYTGTQYLDKQYDVGPGPAFGRDEWTSEKDSLGLEQPSLPYYIDGTVRLTGSVAILRHLARQHDLEGNTKEEQRSVEEAVRVVNERNGALDMLFYTTYYETSKASFMAAMGKTLERFSILLRSHKFVAGKRITFADFMLFELLERYELLDPDCLSSFSNLQGFKKRFTELPAIRQYLASAAFRKIRERLNGRMARSGVGWYFATERNV